MPVKYLRKALLGLALALLLCVGGQNISLRDAAWKLTGVDIGMSV